MFARNNFRKICKISPIAMGLSVFMCICLYLRVCYNREHRSYLSENKKK